MKQNSKLWSALRYTALVSTMFGVSPVMMAETGIVTDAPNVNAVWQVKKITGVVKDEMGPLIGATVQVSNGAGIVTDLDGNFVLENVPENATITVSYVGYVSQTIKVAGKSTFNITLSSDAQVLDELVVIGYGVQKKSNVTGAISSVKSDDLKNMPVTNAASALQGKVSGVQIVNNSGAPGSSPTIRIRGYASNGTSDPLFIVDGLKVDNIDYLEPSAIDRMEILKDAASAAIYGAEAGNGVVLITTKQGSKGKTTVTFDAQWSFSSLANKVDMMNAEQYTNYYSEATEAFMTSYNQYYKDQPYAMVNGKPADTDWQDEVFTTGKMQKYNVGFQGGGENNNFFLSMGYMNNDGMLEGNRDYYERISSQINASYKMNKWLEVGTNNSLQYSKYNAMGEGSTEYGIMRSLYQIDPLTPAEYTNGLPEWLQGAIDGGQHPVQNPDNGNYYGISWAKGNPNNPLMELSKGTSGNRTFSINGTSYMNITPLKGLVFTSRLGYNFANASANNYSPASTYGWNQEGGDKKMELAAQQMTTRYYQWENFINYNFSWGKNDFSLMAGTSYKENEVEFMRSSTDALSSDADNFHYLDYSTVGATDLISGNLEKHRQIAYYGRLGWSYGDRYNVQVNFRADSYDASYLSTANRWGYFPSISAGWTITNEKFMQNLDPKWLSFAKLRLSWGKNGSISNLGGYMHAATLNTGAQYVYGQVIATNSYWMNGQLYQGTYPNEYHANPKLSWEESRQFDLGLDLRFFDHRLAVSMDYYNKLTDGLLVQSQALLTTGTTWMWQNLGKIRNSGFELEAEWRDNIGKDFSYSIKGNLATVKNEVTEYKGKGTRIDGFSIRGAESTLSYFEEGYPIWYLRGYEIDHIDEATGEAIYKDFDGVDGISEADRTDLGNGIPDYTYGLTLNLKYKNFDFMAYGAGAQGVSLFYGITNVGDHYFNKPTFLYHDRWTPEHTQASMPSPLYQTDNKFFNSNAFIFDASYFKIKQIQLGYTVPKNWLAKVGLSSLRAFISLDNFFTFTDYPGVDPEVRSTTSSAMGIDVGGYPIAKSVSFGFNVSL